MFSHLPYTDSVIFDRFIGLRNFEVSMRRLIVMIPSLNDEFAVFFDEMFREKFVFKLIEINSFNMICLLANKVRMRLTAQSRIRLGTTVDF